MKRIDVFYGNQHYSVADRTIDQLTDEIEEAVADGGGWLTVNYGDGSRVPALLYVGQSTPIAVAERPEA
ncbi:hypothetical protein [Schumannella soli]|uniref:Uncharacterized protein n=1 Tax=Schumannella soli TaxID=2590779 RepID=A0A506Y6K0_9MICO|nr:hypothetical protein [Schumannella soli]TPW77503.1 hypothetical protein FJ657_02135 [Schumannella soli]